jgi:hypothetical protein
MILKFRQALIGKLRVLVPAVRLSPAAAVRLPAAATLEAGPTSVSAAARALATAT